MRGKTSTWIRLIASSVLAVFLTAVLIIGISGENIFSGGFFSGGIGFFSSHYDNADRYTAGNGEIDAEALEALDIDWKSGSVTVARYLGDSIQIAETSPDALTEETKVHYYFDGRTLHIRPEASKIFLFARNSKKNLEIRIPDALASGLKDISCDSVSGTLSFTGLSTDSLSLETVSGDFTFNGAARNFDGETVSGNGECNFSSAPESVDLETVSGDLLLRLPPDSDFLADYDTVSGDFNCNFPSRSLGGDSLLCGDGENTSRRYDFDTVSGNISLLATGK